MSRAGDRRGVRRWRLLLAAALLACLVAEDAAARSSLSLTVRAGLPLLRDTLRQSLAGGKALAARYQALAAGGHATVRLGYRADVPRLTLVPRGSGELLLEVPVTVSRLGGDSVFIHLSKAGGLGYQVNGCGSLVLVARAAVTLSLRDGVLRLSPSPRPPAGAVQQGGCTVTKKPAADIAKGLAKAAADVIGFFGNLLRDKALRERSRTLKRQVDGLPARVVVHDMVRDAADAAVRDAVARALAEGHDKLLDQLVRSRISQGLDRGLSARGGVVSLDLRPAGVTMEAAALEPDGLVVEARAELQPRLGFAGAAAGSVQSRPADPGFALPFELVLPVRALPAPRADGEWLVPLAEGAQTIGLAAVPGEDGLVGVRLHHAGPEPRTIIYLSAAVPTGPAPEAGGPGGDLDRLLTDVVDWLDVGAGLPTDARPAAEDLSGRFEAFRHWIELVLGELARLELGDKAVLEVTEPRIEISPGRYYDGLIRLPVRLIGRGRIDVTL